MSGERDFQSVAMPHLDAVYRTALALCHSREEAADLAQATYARALERFSSFQAGTNCRAWLLTILRNVWIDRLRHRQVAGPEVDITEHQVAAANEPPESSPVWTGAGEVLGQFGDDEVRQALLDLPEDQRLTLLMVDVEGLSQDEAAKVLGIASGTVKSRTSRAREALKRRLMEHAKELGLLGRKP
jgi:RNA polymerase sigma-70 factor, ECF subfamily